MTLLFDPRTYIRLRMETPLEAAKRLRKLCAVDGSGDPEELKKILMDFPAFVNEVRSRTKKNIDPEFLLGFKYRWIHCFDASYIIQPFRYRRIFTDCE